MTVLDRISADGFDDLERAYRAAPEGVRVNMIFSADGAAAFGGRAGPLSNPADQRLLRALRTHADEVLVAAGTARTEHYGPVRLTDEQRENRLPRSDPPIAVVSRSGVLPDSLFAAGGVLPILITSSRAAGEHDFAQHPHWRVLTAGEHEVDVVDAVRQLREAGMARVLCEGGPTLLDQLVDADLVDELCVTMSPALAGYQPVGGRNPAALATPARLDLEHALIHDDGYVFLKYRRDRSEPADAAQIR
jgi:riboflavin biosynthesis pyrimidine reductase